jgi:hypothetical protein
MDFCNIPCTELNSKFFCFSKGVHEQVLKHLYVRVHVHVHENELEHIHEHVHVYVHELDHVHKHRHVHVHVKVQIHVRHGGSAVARLTVVLQAQVPIRRLPTPTADCQSCGGFPPGMALGCGLTSVGGDRGENFEK